MSFSKTLGWLDKIQKLSKFRGTSKQFDSSMEGVLAV